MHHLLCHKMSLRGTLLTATLLLAIAGITRGQILNLNMPDHDDKRYFLGIGLIYNNSRFQVAHDNQFLINGNVQSINPLNTGGFGLAGMHTLRLSPRFEIRAVFPQLLFSYKSLAYRLKEPDGSLDETFNTVQTIESILLGLPVHVKFRSDRIGNFRVYMFGGGKIEYDLMSSAGKRQIEGLVKLTSMDYGIEGGIGFSFYFPVFILSPEIKISNGLRNLHSRDASNKFSSTIDRLSSRMLVFSLIFEG